MPQLDSKVAAIVDSATKDDDSDEDALIAALEDDEELDGFREQRLQQLHAEFDNARRLRANEHGTYGEIKDEKALMDITTNTKLCVVHFFKPDFNRCRIMDNHLEVSFHSIETLSGKKRAVPCVSTYFDLVHSSHFILRLLFLPLTFHSVACPKALRSSDTQDQRRQLPISGHEVESPGSPMRYCFRRWHWRGSNHWI
jgi:hypothetical protein